MIRGSKQDIHRSVFSADAALLRFRHRKAAEWLPDLRCAHCQIPALSLE
jgi:hypothetical protein